MTSTNNSMSNVQAPGFTESDFEDLDLELELDDLDDLGNFDETGAGDDDNGNEDFQEEEEDFPELNEEDDGDYDFEGGFPTPRETDNEEGGNQTDSNEAEEEEFEEPLLDKRRHKTQAPTLLHFSLSLFSLVFPNPFPFYHFF